MFRIVRLALFSVLLVTFASFPLLAQSPASAPDPSSAPAAGQPNASEAAPRAEATAPVPAQAATPMAPAASEANSAGKDRKKDDHKNIEASEVHNPTLWHDPGNIASKDMFYGAGGQDGQPKPPFTFLDEDLHDSNPKLDARDANGLKWRVKFGAESRPEVVASRLLWAVGYYVNIDYCLHEATILNMHMKRGNNFIHNGDQVIDVRFARKPDGEKRIAAWAWKSNPFVGTREFNGLRVMMAVMNSWDLKDENNAVYKDKKTGQQIFLVSDIGATFATNGLRVKNVHDKGNVKKFEESKFITSTTPTTVSFGTPAPPTDVLMESLGGMTPAYFRRKSYDWIGDNIPRADARWIGSLLGQLSHQQLVDAFRAGNFTPEETNEYVSLLEQRIAQLKAL